MTLDLPPAYSCVRAPDGDYLTHARELATAGTKEGTIVEGTIVHAPFSDDNQPQSDAGPNLQFCLIMQPDYPAAATHELQIIAVISLAETIASVLSPMITLRFGWPAEIRLNDLIAAQCSIELSPENNIESDANPVWAIINISAYVGAPTPIGFTSINALCETPTSSSVVLETFARNFLSLINRWSEDGFDTVSKPWRQRFDFHEDELVRLRTVTGEVTGTVGGIERDGSLVIQSSDLRHQFALHHAISGESTRFCKKA